MQIQIKEFDTALDAFEVYEIFQGEDGTAFLDSGTQDKKLSHYSFIGIHPYLSIHGREKEWRLSGVMAEHLDRFGTRAEHGNASENLFSNPGEGDFYDGLKGLLKLLYSENPTQLPMVAGCIGYLSYDFGVRAESIQMAARDELDLPQYYFVFYDQFIIFDHWEEKQYLTSCAVLDASQEWSDPIFYKIRAREKEKGTQWGAKGCKEQGFSQEAEKARQNSDITPSDMNNRIQRVNQDILDINVSQLIQDTAMRGSNLITSNFTEEEYRQTVEQVREYIRSGDIYIANLTQRFHAVTSKGAAELYRKLRSLSPAPFAAFLNYDGFEILSSSPERFVSIVNGRVETRPIKGTRPRGRNPQEDEKNRQELMDSEKDRAELLMIVDLERNDLSKVCKPYSVKVTELFGLEEYSTVFHLVSTVQGELKDGKSAVDCMKACFPGGSITGTPKIRAMEIIDELEGLSRGIYTGCIGYFSLDGNADFNIAIRTMIKKQKDVFFGVGGGITWDSESGAEYQETLDKAGAMMRTLM